MRVRHLQSHLTEQSLVYQGRLDRLKGVRVGVDAVFWLRSIQALKDPFADALGGIPPGIFGFVDKELEAFRRADITPLFVFQGVAPGPQHSMFVSRLEQQMEQAWNYLAQNQKAEAQKCFAVSTSRINGDFVYFIFHHLRAKGFECLQAPYFAGAQLAHLMEQGVVQTVFGPPGLLLYGVATVIMQINFGLFSFDWVDLEAVLKKWGVTKDQFVDACMLAGTEYCLTYPYLNLTFGQQPSQRSFSFDAAVYIVKQAPLINWMQTFPTEEMKNDHVEGYRTCKVLVEYSPVLHFQDHAIRPLGSGNAGQTTRQIPRDFSVIMGDKLPNSMYYLMLTGIISHKIPQALAKGEWTDKAQPLVDTAEYREFVGHLGEYRERALGLIARHLYQSFQGKQVLQKAYWEQHARSTINSDRLPPNARLLKPDCRRSLKWSISKEALEAEMKRQKATKVDFKFCLNWHDREYAKDGPLVRNLNNQGNPAYSNDPRCLAALVHFMVLENLDFIGAEDGSATVLGSVLKDSPVHLQEPCLVALELMKCGMLNGDPFMPAQAERPFPEAVKYPQHDDHAPRSRMLLSRVMSLVPMRLRNDMWNADVDFDLTAFHSLIRVLKRALRQLVEGSLASVLLNDMSRVKLLPAGFMCSTPSKENHLESAAIMPTFMLPRACMGIVLLFFLDYKGDPKLFEKTVGERFACCTQPVEDLKIAFAFWEDLKRCVSEIAEPLEAGDLLQSILEASRVLEAQQQKLGIFPDKQ